MKTDGVSNLRASLCLPRTPFSMRARLPTLERDLLERWRKMDLYGELLKARSEGPSFVMHDGPPYASGSLQWGHILNKILKDFVLRSRSMLGQRCNFIPGWDCHGLPIELEVAKYAGESFAADDKVAMRRACRAYAEESIAVQKDMFQRLGVLGHWDDAFITMSPKYQASITRALATLMRSESLVQRTRPVFWCASCETALAEFEVSFLPRETPEAYTAFPLISDPIHLDRNLRGRDVEIVSQTANVWMTPTILAMGVHPEATYVAVRMQRKVYLVAEDCLATVAEACQWGAEPEVIHRLPGSVLVSLQCRHPLVHRHLPILGVPNMRMRQGSGIAQISPGHDPTFCDVSLEHELEMFSPVDEKGQFTSQVEHLVGQLVWDVEPRILQQLQEMDALLSAQSRVVEQNYPHCWKCSQAVLFRATPQWFVPMDSHDLRQRAVDALSRIEWLPAWGKQRMASLLQRRTDWCLSRQRVWGVPLPIFYCTRCREPWLDPDHVEHIASRYEDEPDGADLWFREPIEALFPLCEGELRCERCGNDKFRKEEDIVDVWFDSGISAWAVLQNGNDNEPLADMVFEGVDQYRGWFQGSLLSTLQLEVDTESLRPKVDSLGRTLSGTFPAFGLLGEEEPEEEKIPQRLPFQQVLSHGRIVGEVSPMTAEQDNVQAAQLDKGQSDSDPNLSAVGVVEDTPQHTLDRWGAELLRLWVAEDDFQTNRVIASQDYKLLSHKYRKVRNTFRFLLGNLYDFDESKDAVEWELMEDVDRYALHLLHERSKAIREHYIANEFHKAWHHIYEFCVEDLSGFYFEVLKDRLYHSGPDWYVRRSAQSAFIHIARILCRCVAPILCFTAEDIWQHIPGENSSTVHWTLLPEPDETPTANDQAGVWNGLKSARKQVLRAFAKLKSDLKLKRPWEVAVRLYPNTEVLREALELCDEEQLPIILGVSQAMVVGKDKLTPREAWRSNYGSLAVAVKRADGRRCRRCRFFYKELQNAGSSAMCSRCKRAMEP